jgi:hypothetical protein
MLGYKPIIFIMFNECGYHTSNLLLPILLTLNVVGFLFQFRLECFFCVIYAKLKWCSVFNYRTVLKHRFISRNIPMNFKHFCFPIDPYFLSDVES